MKLKRCRLHAGIADESSAQPGRHHTGDLVGLLRELGATDAEVAEGEACAYALGLQMAAESVRQIAASLPNTAQGRALRIALVGGGGRSFENHAAEVGCTRGNLCRDVQRASDRLRKIREVG